MMNNNNRFNQSFTPPTADGVPFGRLQPSGFLTPSSKPVEAERGFQPGQNGAHPGPPMQNGVHPGPPMQNGARPGPPMQNGAHPGPPMQNGVHPGPPMQNGARPGPPMQNAPITISPALAQSFSRSSQRLKNNRYLLIGLLLTLVVLIGGVVFAMWWFTKSSPNVVLYQVGSAGQNVTQDSGGGGIVFPRQQLDISYPTSELVKSVLVKAGDHVTPNQPLIQLDASLLNIQIQQAASDMAAAQATLNSASISGNALQIAQAQQTYQLAKDRYDALVAQAASPTLHNGNLISPMAGVVTAVNVNPGAVIAANTPLITIMDESIVIVHAKIPLSNLGAVRLGQQVTVTPSALPDLSMQGVVSSIIPQADPQTDTFEVWVNVINTKQLLLPGMSAFVHIQSAGKAVVLPRLAVLNPDSQAVVYVVENAYTHLRHVQVVGRTASTIFIGQGLKAGEKVVLVGIEQLQDNQYVHVSKTEQNTTTS